MTKTTAILHKPHRAISVAWIMIWNRTWINGWLKIQASTCPGWSTWLSADLLREPQTLQPVTLQAAKTRQSKTIDEKNDEATSGYVGQAEINEDSIVGRRTCLDDQPGGLCAGKANLALQKPSCFGKRLGCCLLSRYLSLSIWRIDIGRRGIVLFSDPGTCLYRWQ